jgi:hypothetical protein
MSHFFSPARRLLLAVGAALLSVFAINVSSACAKESQAVSNQQLVSSLHLLHSIKITLDGADHDYGGHRAAAVKDIGQAQKQLKEALHAVHKGQTTKATGGKGKGDAHPEPQKLSDAQLAAAVPTLQATIKVLEGADHDYGGHRANAVKDLKVSVTQLEKALKFSKANDQNKP